MRCWPVPPCLLVIDSLLTPTESNHRDLQEEEFLDEGCK